MMQGLRRFAAHIIRLWEDGMDTRRLLLQQVLMQHAPTDTQREGLEGGGVLTAWQLNPCQLMLQRHSVVELTLEAWGPTWRRLCASRRAACTPRLPGS